MLKARSALVAASMLAMLVPAAQAAAQETSPSPSPSTAPNGEPAPECPDVQLLVDPRNASGGRVVSDVNGPVYLHAKTDDASAKYSLELLTGATTFRVVRTGSGTATDWTVYPPENSAFRLRAEPKNAGARPCEAGPVVRTYVRPSLTISAVRNSTRDYTFSGRVLPGRGQLVSLYRTDSETSSKPVLTAQTRVLSDGTYRIDRRFTGSGRFGFYVSVAESATNLQGSSRVRPTVIH